MDDLRAKEATIQQIHDFATQVVNRTGDILMAARSLDALATSIGWGLEEPYIEIKGIVSQADEIPDPKQLELRELSAATRKSQERQDFIKFFEEDIRAACEAIQSHTGELLRRHHRD